MNTDQHRSDEDDGVEEYLHANLTGRIIGVFYDVYNELGHGFLESVYHTAMVLALRAAGVVVESDVKIPVYFRGQLAGMFEADVLIDGKVLLELKAARHLDPAHESQLLNYLRATTIEVGLLLNFGVKPQVKRLLFDNPRKRQRGLPEQ